MEEMMDQVDIQSDDQGTTITMHKYLPNHPKT